MNDTMQAPPAHGTNGHAVRLNLGAGGVFLNGFDPVDRKDGHEVFPLSHADNSVEEIYASHVLEHFSHRDVATVLQHWFMKLKPGGKLRVAVPDFEKVARDYLDGKPINVQGYVMGGHVDADDKHGAIFDRESLTETLIQCGFERIGLWKSDNPDCASLPISLNLQAFKPSGPTTKLPNVRACMSVPRFGPLLHPRCYQRAFQQLEIITDSATSCFWHQALSNQMEDRLAEKSCEFILTMDFDTIFCAGDVLELYRLLRACPDADAVFPLQSKRGCEQALFSITDDAGRIKGKISEGDLARNLLPANTGHFGLTLFRAESLRKFKRPWMVPEPNAEGLWRDGQTDADIDFWRRFKAQGFNVFLAPKVVVGHLEEVVKWPGKDLKAVYQNPSDYDDEGIPAEVAR